MASNVTVYLNRSASPFARLVRMLRTCGKARTAYAIVRTTTAARWWPKRLQFPVTEVFNVSVSDLDRSQRIPRVFAVRRAEEKDLPALQKYFAAPERVRDRFRRGNVCVMTLAEGEICAAVWLAAGPADIREDWDDIRCVFSVPADVAWSFDGRGAKVGAWGSLMARLPEFLDELHIAEIFTLIDFRNRPSFASHKSLGYQSVGLIFLPADFRTRSAPVQAASGQMAPLAHSYRQVAGIRRRPPLGYAVPCVHNARVFSS